MKVFLTIFLILSVYHVTGKEILLEKVNNVKGLHIFDGKIYINDNGEKVKIYNLKTFGYIGEFGKTGDGPGEFRVHSMFKNINIRSYDGMILVKSLRRLSFFKPDGTHLKDLNIKGSSYDINPVVGGYIFIKMKFPRNKAEAPTDSVVLGDSSLKEKRVLFKRESPMDFRKKKFPMFMKNISMAVNGDSVFVSISKEFKIEVFNVKTGKLSNIIYPYKRLPVTDKDREKVLERLRKRNMNASNVEVPENFPAIKQIYCDSKNLYIQTYKYLGTKREIMVFAFEGNFKKSIMVDLGNIENERPYPFTIFDGKLYRVKESEDGDWLIKTVKI